MQLSNVTGIPGYVYSGMTADFISGSYAGCLPALEWVSDEEN